MHFTLDTTADQLIRNLNNGWSQSTWCLTLHEESGTIDLDTYQLTPAADFVASLFSGERQPGLEVTSLDFDAIKTAAIEWAQRVTDLRADLDETDRTDADWDFYHENLHEAAMHAAQAIAGAIEWG